MLKKIMRKGSTSKKEQNVKPSESESILQNPQLIHAQRDEGGKRTYQKQMRMMMSAMRTIQAPVADLCGLQNVEIPETNSIYHYAKVMNSCGTVLAAMIENMKLYYLVSSGQYESHLSDYSLRAEIQNVWNSCIKDYLSESNLAEISDKKEIIECGLNICQSVPTGLVNGDPSVLVKAFGGLINNALRFTHRGFIDITISAMSDIDDSSTMVLHAMVKDTGVGVPSASTSLIFDPLVKAHKDSIPGGVGMGLSLSRAMARFAKGDTILEKTDETGSIFHSYFPIIRLHSYHPDVEDEMSFSMTIDYSQGIGTSTTTINNDESMSNRIMTNMDMNSLNRVSPDYSIDSETSPGTRILAVDDIKLNRNIVSKILNRFSVTVDEAENGQAAVEKCSEIEYDLILMDIHMPIMNGLDASKLIRNNPGSRNRNTPIIALSGDRPGEIYDICKDAGINDCIIKPVQTRSLIEIIAKYVRVSHRLYLTGKLNQTTS